MNSKMNGKMNGSTSNRLPQNPHNALAPAAEAQLDPRIDAALAHQPTPLISSGFAAAIAVRAAALPQRRRAFPVPIGRSIAWVSIALLAVALFALAPHATPSLSSFRFDAEILVLLELAGLGWGLARFNGQLSR